MTKIDLLVVGQADWSTVFAGVLVNTSLAPSARKIFFLKKGKMVQTNFSDVKTKEKIRLRSIILKILSMNYAGKSIVLRFLGTSMGKKYFQGKKQAKHVRRLEHAHHSTQKLF